MLFDGMRGYHPDAPDVLNVKFKQVKYVYGHCIVLDLAFSKDLKRGISLL